MSTEAIIALIALAWWLFIVGSAVREERRRERGCTMAAARAPRDPLIFGVS